METASWKEAPDNSWFALEMKISFNPQFQSLMFIHAVKGLEAVL
jgi:hypothetical protein